MFVLLTILCISTKPISGGWQKISVDSEQIRSIQEYLDRNLPLLFPEIQNGTYTIASAKLQIVNGMNLKLVIKSKISPLMFKLFIYVDHNQHITLKNIKPPFGTRPIIGSYNWQKLSRFTAQDLKNLIKIIQMKVNLIIKEGGEVIVYRTKVENTLFKHVVFRDGIGNIFSVITGFDSPTVNETLVSVHQIF